MFWVYMGLTFYLLVGVVVAISIWRDEQQEIVRDIEIHGRLRVLWTFVIVIVLWPLMFTEGAI